MKTFKQFCIELNLTDTEIRDAVSKEQNIGHSLGRSGHNAPGYSYAGKRRGGLSASEADAKELRDAQKRSQKRQGM